MFVLSIGGALAIAGAAVAIAATGGAAVIPLALAGAGKSFKSRMYRVQNNYW